MYSITFLSNELEESEEIYVVLLPMLNPWYKDCSWVKQIFQKANLKSQLRWQTFHSHFKKIAKWKKRDFILFPCPSLSSEERCTLFNRTSLCFNRLVSDNFYISAIRILGFPPPPFELRKSLHTPLEWSKITFTNVAQFSSSHSNRGSPLKDLGLFSLAILPVSLFMSN